MNFKYLLTHASFLCMVVSNYSLAAHVNDRAIYQTDVKTASGASVFSFPTTHPTASRVCTFNSDGEATSSSVSDATLAFLDATSSVQTQLNTLTTSAAGKWSLTGNSGTTAGTNFLGTTDGVDLVFKRDSVERARLKANDFYLTGPSNSTGGPSSEPTLTLGGGSTNYRSLVFDFGTNPTQSIQADLNGGMSYYAGSFFSHRFYLGTSTPFMLMNASGMVLGGGGNGPGAKLDVYGDAIVRGTAQVTGLSAGALVLTDSTSTLSDDANNLKYTVTDGLLGVAMGGADPAATVHAKVKTATLTSGAQTFTASASPNTSGAYSPGAGSLVYNIYPRRSISGSDLFGSINSTVTVTVPSDSECNPQTYSSGAGATGVADASGTYIYSGSGNWGFDVIALYAGSTQRSASANSISFSDTSMSGVSSGDPYLIDLHWDAPGGATPDQYLIIRTTDNTYQIVSGASTSLTDYGNAWGSSPPSYGALAFAVNINWSADFGPDWRILNTTSGKYQDEASGSTSNTDYGNTWASGSTVTPTTYNFPTLISEGDSLLVSNGGGKLSFFGSAPISKQSTVDPISALTYYGLISGPTPINASYGGTGQSFANIGDILYGNGVGWSRLGRSTSATRYLANTGTSNAPAWDQINLSNGVTGTLPAANGGTGGNFTFAAGTYTPTLTNVANLGASSAFLCQYSRIGSSVTGSCRITVDAATTLTDTQLGVSLPVSSNFGAVQDAAGSCSAPTIVGESAGIEADATNDRMVVRWKASDINSHDITCSFTYRII